MKHSIFICGLIIGILSAPAAPALAALPPDFQNLPLLTAGLDNPTALALAPDGRLFIAEQSGTIKIFKNDGLLSEPFATLPALALNDRGLLGAVVDPDFGSNHYVYFYYVDKNDSFHKIARFDAENDVDSEGPTIVYSSNRVAAELHAGGGLDFGSDGKLYVSIGDSGPSTNAQDLSIPMGKVLRMNKDGSVPSDNPFVGLSGHDAFIWAYGFRNPFRMQFDREAGKLYLGDVGFMKWEEINLVEKGGNYGWPLAEGDCGDCAFKNPIHTYENAGGASVVVGPVYRGEVFPLAYTGRLFFGDYVKKFIKTLDVGSDGATDEPDSFESSAGSVIDIEASPDGTLYYLTIFPGSLHRIIYGTDDQFPTASASADRVVGEEPLTVHFSSVGSSDPEGSSLSYSWDFGDGTVSTEANPTKVYTERGRYTVKLTVSDGTHSVSTDPLVIQVGTAPVMSDIEPENDSLYSAGETVNYSVQAKDHTGLSLPPAAFTTEVVFHHNTHVHPFIPVKSGNSGSFSIPTTGETATDVWYEIIFTVRDGDGAESTTSVAIRPRISSISLKTEPAGLTIHLDGQPQTMPYSIGSVVGIERQLAAESQVFDGKQYIFDHWSDDGLSEHPVVTPSSPATYTAFFRAVTPFRGEYFNNFTLSGTPALTRDDALIDFVWNESAPDPSVNVDRYSVRWTKEEAFAAGRYRFITSTDDGVRLFIDDIPIINEWHDQALTRHTATVDLSAGVHDIRMEYYEAAGGAIAKLLWALDSEQPNPPSPNDFAASYFANQDLAGSPILMQTEPAIDFAWGASSPDPIIPNDHFSARFTQTKSYAAGPYAFTVTVDDGVRLYLDDELILDQWIDQPSTMYTVERELSAGPHTLRLEYYESSGGAILSFATAAATPWSAAYWNMPGTSSSPTLPDSLPALTRSEPIVDFNWGDASPGAGISQDHFGARLSRDMWTDEGNYTLRVTADDGVRVRVDGALVIDEWRDQGPTQFSTNVPLSLGKHAFNVEYYENGGGAVLQLSLERRLPVSGSFTAEYFGNQFLSGAPLVTAAIPQVGFNWGEGSPDVSVPNDQFSARFTKAESFSAGKYRFLVDGDDGVRFFVDDVPVVGDWSDHPTRRSEVVLDLDAGVHTLRIEYYENDGRAVVRFKE